MQDSKKKMSEQRQGWAHMDPTVREETRQKLVERMSAGSNHPKSKSWTLLSPSGRLVHTAEMSKFCEENDLSYFALRNKAVACDTTPITRGKSKGWSVLLCLRKNLGN